VFEHSLREWNLNQTCSAGSFMALDNEQIWWWLNWKVENSSL